MTTTQSVVVPVEPTEAMLVAPDEAGVGLYSREVFAKIWSAMLAAAPAPSSLAGGEVERAARTLLAACIADFGDPADYPEDDGWVASGDKGDSAVTFKQMRDLQAALSPEAPVREGAWLIERSEGGVTSYLCYPQGRRHDWTTDVHLARRYATPEEAVADTNGDPSLRVAEHIFGLTVPAILAALSPEAPAREGVKYAVTSEYAVGITEHDPALTPRHEAPAEGAGEDWRPMVEFPYTGKQKPVAVLCDNGEVHAANWKSTRWIRKERRYEQALGFFDHSGSGLNPVGWKPLSALRAPSSAAPSADKLRIAVEALKRAKSDIVGWYEAVSGEDLTEESHAQLLDDVDAITQALAALKAEGA